MKLFSVVLVLAVATEVTVASSWFSKAIYNKWHETELERWLSDHDIPYPTPADRKDLENLVQKNWQNKVTSPYADWHPSQLQAYLKDKGVETKDGAKDSKDSLVSQVKQYWYEAEDQAEEAYSSVKSWIFDSWSDSQLKAFLDKHGIPCPQPRKRDTLLAAARENYETIARKAGETAAYPGDWLYSTWSDSGLKAWLDERGIPVPQPTKRDKLIAYVRRNGRIASLKSQAILSSASASAASAQASLSDTILDSWSNSQIKEWADKNGIKVPQGSKRNELLALARKHKASLTGDTLASSASNVYGAATSKAGNEHAKATGDASDSAQNAFDSVVASWSDTRLKAYLDSRGVPVPQAGKRDELLAKVRLHKYKAATGYSAWTFDTWTTENLKKYLSGQSNKVAQKAAEKKDATREELVKHAQDSYASASRAGGAAYASVTSALAAATDSAKETTFDTWSDSDLKSYLDSYGIPVYQGSTTNELRAFARRQHNYFKYGTSSPASTLWAKLKVNVNWVLEQLKIRAAKGQQAAEYQGEKATSRAKEGATYATNRAGEEAQKAKHRVKEEL